VALAFDRGPRWHGTVAVVVPK